MSSSHVSTVASRARHVNPSGLIHPFPFTVTGPTLPLNSMSDELAVTSHETPVCARNRRFRAASASVEMSDEVTPPGATGGEGIRILLRVPKLPVATMLSEKAFTMHCNVNKTRTQSVVAIMLLVDRWRILTLLDCEQIIAMVFYSRLRINREI